MSKHRLLQIVLASCILCPLCASAQTQPTTAPASQPSITPQAKLLVDQVGQAYANAKSISLSGKISLDLDAAGQQKHDSSDFTASFVAPNKFRHEIKDDVLVVSTGATVYAYLPDKNQYVSADIAPDRTEIGDLSDTIRQLLDQQDPVLLLAIAKTPSAALIDGATNVSRGDDIKLGDTSYQALNFNRGNDAFQILIDPTTHLIRQIRDDRKATLAKQGVDDVKAALITFDYPTTKLDAAPDEALFAWSPPKDATVAKEDAPQDASADATVLEGKAAPDFKLGAIDGSNVSLADLKGSVAVLDFFATWCGPCCASLPEIDKVRSEYADKGLKLYAVNLQEAKPDVQKFVATQKLGMPVLLDTDGEIAKKYLANAIPETVVIGKDGNIKKVFVGFGGDETPLKQAIEAAMK